MEKVYQFKEQLQRGEFFERVLDDFFKNELFMAVEEVPMELQRVGVDRILTSLSTNTRLSVEVKSDERGQDTGNAFLESVSVERQGAVEKWGWIYTSMAQVLAYYLPLSGELILTDMPELKRKFVTDYLPKYRRVPIQNPSYTGHGYIVPLTELRKDAFGIFRLDPVSYE